MFIGREWHPLATWSYCTRPFRKDRGRKSVRQFLRKRSAAPTIHKTPLTIIKPQQWRRWRKRSVVTICAITFLWFWTHGTPALNDMNDYFMRTKSHPASAAWSTWPLSIQKKNKTHKQDWQTCEREKKVWQHDAWRLCTVKVSKTQPGTEQFGRRFKSGSSFVMLLHLGETDGETLLQPPLGSFRSTLITFNK